MNQQTNIFYHLTISISNLYFFDLIYYCYPQVSYAPYSYKIYYNFIWVTDIR